MTMLTNSPRFLSGAPTIRRGFALFLARLGRRVDRWVAALIARRARQTALAALSRLSDRELKDTTRRRCFLEHRGAKANAATGAVLTAPAPRWATYQARVDNKWWFSQSLELLKGVPSPAANRRCESRPP